MAEETIVKGKAGAKRESQREKIKRLTAELRQSQAKVQALEALCREHITLLAASEKKMLGLAAEKNALHGYVKRLQARLAQRPEAQEPPEHPTQAPQFRSRHSWNGRVQDEYLRGKMRRRVPVYRGRVLS